MALWLTLLTNPVRAQSNRADGPVAENLDDDRKFDDLPREEKKELMKRVIPPATIVVVSMFSILLLWALLRGWRRQRRIAGLGQKAAPTDYVDVWSQHKLDDAETDDPASSS
jgi:hypothetical protein